MTVRIYVTGTGVGEGKTAAVHVIADVLKRLGAMRIETYDHSRGEYYKFHEPGRAFTKAVLHDPFADFEIIEVHNEMDPEHNPEFVKKCDCEDALIILQ